jgi:hypothetical protein
MRDFLNDLATAFKKLTRTEQIELIAKFSTIITVWVAVVVSIWSYQFLTQLQKIFLAPALIALAWLFAKAAVTPFMISKFERYLN